MWRANLYRKQVKYKESIQAYVQVVKIDPSLLVAQRNLGWLYRRLEHPVQSIRHYKKVVEIEPDDYKTLNILGVMHEKIKRDQTALEYYEGAIECQPQYAIAHANLGKLHQRRNRYNDAISAYKEVLKIDNKFILARNQLAQLYLEQRQFDEAIKLYEGTIRISPDVWDHYFQLALAFNRCSRHALLHTHLGRSLFLISDYSEAEVELRAALDIDANYALAKYNLAIVLTEKDMLEEAVDLLKQVIQSESRFARLAKAESGFRKLLSRPEFEAMTNIEDDKDE